MKILHPDHIRAYLDAAERRGVLPMFYLELISGLRKGELVALQWTDLDEANCTISVSKQASWDTDGTLILSQPKTGNSIREVSIPQDAVELLTSPFELAGYKEAIMEAMYKGTKRNIESEMDSKNAQVG